MFVRSEAVFKGVLKAAAGNERLKAGEGPTRAAVPLEPIPPSSPFTSHTTLLEHTHCRGNCP